MKFSQAIVVVVFFIILAHAGLAGSTVDIKTGDDLTLCFAKNGQLPKVMIGRHTIKNRGSGGFFARDIVNGIEDVFKGRIYRQRKSLFFSGKNRKLGLNLDATIDAQGRRIEFLAKIKDTNGLDRAVSLFFAIPVDALGWDWYDHLREKRTIEAGKIYEESVPIPAGESGKMARYCWSGISNDQIGLSLGIPMDSPAVYRLIYDSQSKQLIIRYDIGLTKDSKIPSTAKVKFILYKINDPAWGMRSVLKKYYEMYPKWFEKRVKKDGAWKNVGRIEDISSWEDFQFGFHEHPVDEMALEFNKQHGIYSFYYDEPWDFWMPMPKGRKYTYDEIVQYLKKMGSTPGIHKHGASLSSSIYDENQKIIGNLQDTHWNYGGWFPLNTAPEIPPYDGSGVNAAEYSAQLYLKNIGGSQIDRKYSGVYFDGSPEYTGQYLNYRREHFKYTESPLTFSKDNKKVAVLNLFTNYEYLVWMSEKIHALGLLTMCNGPMRESFGFYNHAVDIPGTEVWWSQGKYLFRPQSDMILSFRRSFSYQKPYLLLMSGVQNFNHDMVTKYVKKSMVFGMIPSMNGGAVKIGDQWQKYEFYNSDMQTRDQDVFRKFLHPTIQLSRSGWEPVTYATPSSPDILIERFGYSEKGTLHFTCFNEGNNPVRFDLKIDRGKLNIQKEGLYVLNVLNRDFRAVATVDGTINIKDNFLDSEDIAVFHVGLIKDLYNLQHERAISNLRTTLRDLASLKAKSPLDGNLSAQLESFQSVFAQMKSLNSSVDGFRKDLDKTIGVLRLSALTDVVLANSLLRDSLTGVEKDLELISSMLDKANSSK